MPVCDRGLRIRNRSQLGVGAHVARSVRAGQAAVLTQQPSAAVAVAFLLRNKRSGSGLEELHTAAQLLGETQGTSQQVARRCVDAVERCVEVLQRLLHMREHVFTLACRCHKQAFSY